MRSRQPATAIRLAMVMVGCRYDLTCTRRELETMLDEAGVADEQMALMLSDVSKEPIHLDAWHAALGEASVAELRDVLLNESDYVAPTPNPARTSKLFDSPSFSLGAVQDWTS